MKRILLAGCALAGVIFGVLDPAEAATICGTVTALGAATTHNFVTTLGTNCTFSIAQPAVTDLASVNAGTVLGNATGSSASPTATPNPVLGVASTTSGSLGFYNSGSANAVTIQAPAGATAAYNFNLPITAGSAGQALISEGGGSTAMQWTTVSVAAFTVTPETTSWTVTSAADATRFNNTGSAATTIGTLPTTPVAGDNWCFAQTTANAMEVLASAGETINFGGVLSASAGNMISNSLGSLACLYFDSATKAYVWTSTGSWTIT